MKKLILLFALCLLTFPVKAKTPKIEPGEPCSILGETRISESKTDIVSCLIKDKTKPTKLFWKTTTSEEKEGGGQYIPGAKLTANLSVPNNNSRCFVEINANGSPRMRIAGAYPSDWGPTPWFEGEILPYTRGYIHGQRSDHMSIFVCHASPQGVTLEMLDFRTNYYMQTYQSFTKWP